MAGFDARKFERDLKKAVEKAANDGMKKIGGDLQRALDSVFRSHRGKPVDQVRIALGTALRRADFTPTVAQLQSWSQAISKGTHINVDVKPTRL